MKHVNRAIQFCPVNYAAGFLAGISLALAAVVIAQLVCQ